MYMHTCTQMLQHLLHSACSEFNFAPKCSWGFYIVVLIVLILKPFKRIYAPLDQTRSGIYTTVMNYMTAMYTQKEILSFCRSCISRDLWIQWLSSLACIESRDLCQSRTFDDDCLRRHALRKSFLFSCQEIRNIIMNSSFSHLSSKPLKKVSI